MRLRVAIILSRGRYVAAGEEIDDELVPELLRRFRIDDEQQEKSLTQLTVDNVNDRKKRPRKS